MDPLWHRTSPVRSGLSLANTEGTDGHIHRVITEVRYVRINSSPSPRAPTTAYDSNAPRATSSVKAPPSQRLCPIPSFRSVDRGRLYRTRRRDHDGNRTGLHIPRRQLPQHSGMAASRHQPINPRWNRASDIAEAHPAPFFRMDRVSRRAHQTDLDPPRHPRRFRPDPALTRPSRHTPRPHRAGDL